MKTPNCIVCLVTLSLVIKASASDSFPVFSTTSIKIAIPTSMQGYKPDSAFEIGTNAIYTIKGQVFTNAIDGHIQTEAEGFSGTTDRATPWKTLTELLAAYQDEDEAKIRSLYDVKSQGFLDKIFDKPETEAHFEKYTSSITNMQVVMGYDHANGFLAIVKISTQKFNQPMPFYFTQVKGAYLLSTFHDDQTNSSNIAVFLNTHSVTNLLK